MTEPRSDHWSPIRSAAPRLLLVLLLLAAPTAGAHAVFGSSKPAPDSQVEVGLTRIEVTLTEDVILEFSGLEVTDLQGADWVAGPTAQGSGANILTVETRPLADGVYVIAWKGLSADTHTTRGQFLIAAGNATLTQRSGSQTDTTEAPGGGTRDALGRAVFYAGLMVALGLPFFFLAVDRERDAPRIALLVTSALALAAALGGVLNLQGLSARTEVPLASLAWSKGGIYLTLRALFIAAAGLVLLAAAWMSTHARRALLMVSVLLALSALASTTLGSHAASVSEARTLAMASDSVHLLVGAVWVGGVVAFCFAMIGSDSARGVLLITRFSPLAMGSVALILATGTYASIRFVKKWDLLFSERYGQLVLAKLALVVVLVAFGALHQRVVKKRLAATGATPRSFRRLLGVEAGVMALVVIAAGALATTNPPQEAVEIDPTPLVFEVENKTKMTHVILQVSPNPVTIGVQTVRVYLHPLTAAPVPNNTRVQLKIWEEGEEEPETTMTPDKTGFGEWTTKAGHFTAPGTWQVKVVFQRPDEGYHRFTFQVPVTLPGQPPAAESTR